MSTALTGGKWGLHSEITPMPAAGCWLLGAFAGQWAAWSMELGNTQPGYMEI
jgi:hypothetical protein